MNKMIKWLGNYWISGAAVIMLGFSIALNFGNFSSNDTGIILTFVGILATFIVVGNYAQVMAIREDSKKAIEDMRADFEKRIIEINEENSKLTKTIEDSIKNAEKIIDCTQLYLEGLVILSKGDIDSIKGGLEILIMSVAYSLEHNQDSTLVPSLSILHEYRNSSSVDIYIKHIADFQSFKEQISLKYKNTEEEKRIIEILKTINEHIQNQ